MADRTSKALPKMVSTLLTPSKNFQSPSAPPISYQGKMFHPPLAIFFRFPRPSMEALGSA